MLQLWTKQKAPTIEYNSSSNWKPKHKMGFQENGNGEMGLEMAGIPLGAKNKYKRMNSELNEDNDDVLSQQQQEERRNSTRKYVLACAIFASLNNVLLGYGMLALKSLWFCQLRGKRLLSFCRCCCWIFH